MIKNSILVLITSALGLGLLPIAPGSFGALLGVGMHLLASYFVPIQFQQVSFIALFLSVYIAGHMLVPWSQTYWQNMDPKNFVLDEVAGYLLIPIFFNYGSILNSKFSEVKTWKVALIGFILFRIFDIFKLIPPAKWIDTNMHSAWGVMLDDLVSAGYAVLVIYICKQIGIL